MAQKKTDGSSVFVKCWIHLCLFTANTANFSCRSWSIQQT